MTVGPFGDKYVNREDVEVELDDDIDLSTDEVDAQDADGDDE